VRQVILSGVTYATFGPATGWQYGNGRTLLRSLNRNYQPDVIHDAGNGGLSLGYGFDAVGNLTMLKDGAQAQVLAQYGYDALNRLEQVMDGATGTPIETYTYDATGNRLGVTNAGTTTPYTYLAESHRLDKVGGVARSYDAVGNTTRIGPAQARQFVYDNSGRMTQVKTGGVVTRQYEYNAKGEQTRAWLDNENTYFVYDEAGHLLGEYASDGSPKQQILWFGDLPVGVLAGSGAGQQLHYIEPDHLGTPRVVIDGVRNVPIWTWALTGEAFGATPPNQDPDGDGTVFNFDLRYPGQRYDGATGLNYNYFRDYDPATGRYAESDPIGLSGGISTFSYVDASPHFAGDPFGLAPQVTGSWIAAPRFNLTRVGLDSLRVVPVSWSWWGYLKFLRIYGSVDGYVNIDVRCSARFNNGCSGESERKWETRARINVRHAGNFDWGPNVYAAAIGMRAGTRGAIGANVALGGAAALYAEHQLLKAADAKAGSLIQQLLQNGPTALCLLHANAQ
jgi:RHS repeat-associated protein